MLDPNMKMDARQVAEYTRAALLDAFASSQFQTRVCGGRLDGSEKERLTSKVMEAMAFIKRGPMREDSVRIDTGEMGYLSRELLQKLRAVKEVRYAALKGRSLVPVSNEVAPGAETFSYEVFDRTGRAKAGSGYEGRAPRADVKVSETIGKIDIIRAAFGWNVQDIRAAAFSGRSLPTMRGMAARAAMEYAIDDEIANGVSGTALTGLINNTDVTVYSIDGASSSTTLSGMTGTWSGATAAQMIADINKLISAVRVSTKEVEMKEGSVDIVLATSAYNAIATTPYSTLSPETTLSALLRTNPWVRSVTSWAKLSAAGVSGRDRSIFYTRDPMNLEAQIPLEIMQHPPEPVALEFLVEMEARCAGVSIYYPGSVAYLDGV